MITTIFIRCLNLIPYIPTAKTGVHNRPVSSSRGGKMTSLYARFLALVALVVLVASGPAFAQTTYTDYDTDDDNLIDITTIAQLQGIRYDHDGDGVINPHRINLDLAPTIWLTPTATPAPPPAWVALMACAQATS